MGFCCFHFHHTSNVCIHFLNYGLLSLHHSREVCRYVADKVLRIDENRSDFPGCHTPSRSERFNIPQVANMTVDFQFQTFRGTKSKPFFSAKVSDYITTFNMVMIIFFVTNRGIPWNYLSHLLLRLVFLAPQPLSPGSADGFRLPWDSDSSTFGT